MMALMKLECNFLRASEASDSRRPRICCLLNSIFDFLILLVEFLKAIYARPSAVAHFARFQEVAFEFH